MSDIREALRRGRGHSDEPSNRGPDAERGGSADAFDQGAAWVRDALVPAVHRANSELQPEDVVFKLDLNLAPESTNHPHADFWLAELRTEHSRTGPRYSLNVIGGRNIWLYKTGAPGVILGSISKYGPEQINELLRNAAEEFGKLLRH